jgi:hypothetical protein
MGQPTVTPSCARPKDLRITRRPRTFEELWNYGSCRDIQRFARRVRAGEPPRTGIFVGDPGCGKTLLGYMAAMWSSCLAWRSGALWCGECEPCRAVMNDQGNWRYGFCEVDAARDDAMDEIFKAYNRSYCPEGHVPDSKGSIHDGFCDNPRPTITLIDEAQHFTPRTQEELLKLLERWGWGNVLLATTDLDRIHKALVSRAGNSVYHITYPTADECVVGLIRVSALEGHVLPRGAAEIITSVGQCQPRKCLDALQEVLIALQSGAAELSAALVGDVLAVPQRPTAAAAEVDFHGL